MTWPQTARRYLACLEELHARARPAAVVPIQLNHPRRREQNLPDIQTGHLLSLCDSTGMLQHAVHSVPGPRSWYCIDDNARALCCWRASLRSPNRKSCPGVDRPFCGVHSACLECRCRPVPEFHEL
jgi:hypothetical protein